MAVQVVTFDTDAQGVRFAPDALRQRDDGLFDLGAGAQGPQGAPGQQGQRGPVGPATAPTVVTVSPLPPGTYTVFLTPMPTPHKPAKARHADQAPVALPTADTPLTGMPGGLSTGSQMAAWYNRNVALGKVQAAERHQALLAGMVDPVLQWVGDVLYRNGVPV